MSEDKNKIIEVVTEKYMHVAEGDKKYILGYMEGVQSERAMWVQKSEEKQSTA